MMITMSKGEIDMTAEEKIVKIKKILEDTVGKNYPKESRGEIETEMLQCTGVELIDLMTDITEMIHDIYDIVEA